MRPHRGGGGRASRARSRTSRCFTGMTRARQHHGRPHAADEQDLFWQLLRARPGARPRRSSTESASRRSSTFLEIQHIRKTPVGTLALRPAEARSNSARALAMEPELLLLDEPMAGMNLEEKEDMSRFILDVNDALRHDDRADRARHGRGDGPVRPRRRCWNTAARSPTARRMQVKANQAVIDAYLGVAH